jgi:hypothetical protein
MLGPEVLEAEEVERGVTARLKRQELLTGDDPVNYRAIFSEAALHRLRGAEYAEAQYRHLLDMANKSNVTIRILPFSRRLHQGMAGGFTVLDFPPDVSNPVAYYDHISGGQLIQDAGQVSRLSEVYEELSALAMSPEETTAFITEWL